MDNVETKGKFQDVMTRKETANFLRIGISQLDRSDIPFIRMGHRKLYRRATLDKWLAQNEGGVGE